MMRNFIKAICAFSMLMSAAMASAQSCKYPSSVAGTFSDADAAAALGQPSTPVIAIPVSGSIDSALVGEVVKAGGVPVCVPSDLKDFNMYRDLAASFDGFVLTPEFVKAMDAQAASPQKGGAALLLIKAVSDRNVPVFGCSDLLKSINAGVKHIDDNFNTIDELVAKACTYKRAKALMQRIFTLDSHNDLACEYRDGASIGKRFTNQVSVQKMTEGYLDATFAVAWLHQDGTDAESTAKAMAKCSGIVNALQADVAKYSDYVGLARNEAEARALKVQGKKVVFIGIENGYGIGNDISLIKDYRDRGVTYMTLCHTGDNAICHTSAAKSPNRHLGLTAFGKEVVAEMNACGMLIDLSHASEQTFWDVCAITKAPVACTHSGAKSLYGHDRNLTDEQLREIKRIGGVCQVYFVDSFMRKDRANASINEMIQHILHCIDVAGIDCVGIGCDFDGGGGGKGINGMNDAINVTVRLMEAGLTDSDLEKVWGGNFLRVLGEAQKLASN